MVARRQTAALRPHKINWASTRELADRSTITQAASVDTSKPVLLLGGRENCLSVTRNLGRLGIAVYVSAQRECSALHSRYCRKAFRIAPDTSPLAAWRKLLIDSPEPELAGAIILAACDQSLEFLTEHRLELIDKYTLQPCDPDLRRVMLDKMATLELARTVGVPTPNFWPIETIDDVDAIRDEIRFPVMVKPHNSLEFAHDFGRKLFIVRDKFTEVQARVAECLERGHKVMVVEMIPGPDSLLSSYYTFRTPKGHRLYDYTKSVIRRWPVNRGGGTFHQSQWLPETAQMGRRLFDGIDWTGIGNVEFKRDLRDGRLKIIEVNARFTAAHRLITGSGAPIDLIIYCHLTGQRPPHCASYSQKIRLWYPLRDFLSYLELRRTGDLSFWGWLRSCLQQPFMLPSFSVFDPLPGLAELWGARRTIARKCSRLIGSKDHPGSSA